MTKNALERVARFDSLTRIEAILATPLDSDIGSFYDGHDYFKHVEYPEQSLRR